MSDQLSRVAESINRFAAIYSDVNSPKPVSRLARIRQGALNIAKYVGIPAILVAAILPLWQYSVGIHKACLRMRVGSAREEYADELARRGEYRRAEQVLKDIGKDPLEGTPAHCALVFAEADRAIHDGTGAESAEDDLAILGKLSRARHGRRARILLSRLRLVKGDIEGANALLQRIKPHQIEGSPDEAAFRYACGLKHELKGEYQAARSEYDRGIAAAQANQDEPAEWEGLLLLANALFAYYEDSETARGLYEQVLDTGNERTRVRARIGLAEMEIHIGEHGDAQKNLQANLYLFDQLDDRVAAARTHLLLGTLNHRQGIKPGQTPAEQDSARVEAARQHYEKSEKIARDAGADPLRLSVLGVLAELERDVQPDQLDQAERHARLLVTLAADRGYPLREERGHHYLGTILHKGKHHERAREEYMRALSLAEKLGDRTGRSHTLCKLGELELDLGRQPQAKIYLEQAWPLAEGDKRTREKIEQQMNRCGQK